MEPRIVVGDLLTQDVEVIVNAWNRNIIPWWLLLPQGISRAIKKRAGLRPFWELGFKGPIPLGGAVSTSAGKLPYKSIIHVAGINMLWMASENSVALSTKNAVCLAEKLGFHSIAFPLIGAGTGGMSPLVVENIMITELRRLTCPLEVTIVKYGLN